MGMPISIDVRGACVPAHALDRAFALLRRADALFSTYRSDSEIMRLNTGGLTVDGCLDDVKDVLGECERLRLRTEGFFDVRASGALDPSGLVKGWAVERVTRLLVYAGVRHACVNAAGDIRVTGGRPGGEPWRVGIRDPFRADNVSAVVELHEGAVATSGAYERGEHVINPHTGDPARGLLSATVVGPDLTIADAFATALFAMGPVGLEWLASQPTYSAMVILPDGTMRSTDSFNGMMIGGLNTPDAHPVPLTGVRTLHD